MPELRRAGGRLTLKHAIFFLLSMYFAPTAVAYGGQPRGAPGGVTVDTNAAALPRGAPQIALPIALPAEEGPLLFDILPRYSIEHPVTEWGVGWTNQLEIVRWTASGFIAHDNTDARMTPWGAVRRSPSNALVWG